MLLRRTRCQVSTGFHARCLIEVHHYTDVCSCRDLNSGEYKILWRNFGIQIPSFHQRTFIDDGYVEGGDYAKRLRLTGGFVIAQCFPFLHGKNVIVVDINVPEAQTVIPTGSPVCTA